MQSLIARAARGVMCAVAAPPMSDPIIRLTMRDSRELRAVVSPRRADKRCAIIGFR